jgi:D-alanyl-D-alanine carboxypeptidase/D-alanyl-D-alanine carboxypeptidase (penicillin-binding protein 5/6)
MPSVRAAAVVLVVAASLLWAGATPAGKAPAKPRITARAYVAVDAATGRVLAARRAEAQLPIASLTKIMTGLLVIERGRLHERISVPYAATLVEPSKEYLVPGRRYKRLTLLWSALLASANDSATALAWDAGGGSLHRFYDLMNERARRLGMTATTYASASGLEDRRNVSTALDQARLARAALRNPLFARIVGSERHWTRWAAPTVAKEWVNHNRMLSTYPGTYGVKTGWTTRAGGCLAVAVRRGGRDVVAVVLGSKGIWHDMPLVLERAFRSAA